MGNTAVVALFMRHFHYTMHPAMVNDVCSGHAFVHCWRLCILHDWVPVASRPSAATTVEMAMSCGVALPVVATAGVKSMVVPCYCVLWRLVWRIFTTILEKSLDKPGNPMAWLVVAWSARGPGRHLSQRKVHGRRGAHRRARWSAPPTNRLTTSPSISALRCPVAASQANIWIRTVA